MLFQDGVALGIVDDQVYVGREVTGKTLTLQWEGSEDSEEREEHESGYLYTEAVSGAFTEVITFTKNERNVYNGSIDVSSESTTTYTESDEWPDEDVDLGDGQIPANLLEGDGNQNAFDGDECSGDDCEITVTATCSGSNEVTATYVGKHNEGLFEGIQDAGRDPGLGGASP